MPYIEGIEAIQSYREEKVKVDRREQWLRQYEKKRNGAILALGGRCECGEAEDGKLQIVTLSEDVKGWSHVSLYKWLIDSSKRGEDLTKVAKLICKKCRFEEMAKAAIARRQKVKGTGCFYWVGGQRVEQMVAKRGVSPQGYRFVYAEHEDLGVEELEVEG